MTKKRELVIERNRLLREIAEFSRVYQFLTEKQQKELEIKWEKAEELKKQIEELK